MMVQTVMQPEPMSSSEITAASSLYVIPKQNKVTHMIIKLSWPDIN